MQRKVDRVSIIELIKCAYIAVSFFLLDAMLRYLTRWLGYYSIFELPPSLFSICWISLFIAVLSLLPYKCGKVIYSIWYGMWAIYAVSQYVYYLIFGNFFFLSDIQYAGEGGAYINFITDKLNVNVFIMLVMFFAFGLIGVILFPDTKKIGNLLTRNIVRIILVGMACVGIMCVPNMYTAGNEALFFSSKYEYEQFSNSGFDMEIAGLYQYVARDAWCTYLRPKEDPQVLYKQIEDVVIGFSKQSPISSGMSPIYWINSNI